MGKTLKLTFNDDFMNDIIWNIEIKKLDIMKGIGESMVTTAKHSFRNQGLMGSGEQWEPNQKGTTILIKTGRLRNSLTILNASKYSVTVGSPLIYADSHNSGIYPQPKRTFLEMNDYMRREILEDLEYRFVKIIEEDERGYGKKFNKRFRK